ncbi:MAG: DUF4411 family protein [Chloroflexota bacterium]
MVDYWLYTGAFIETWKGPYAIDVAPGYWTLLYYLAGHDLAQSPVAVLHELRETRDQLLAWVEERHASFFLLPDEAVYQSFAEVGELVTADYEPPHSNRFLDVADPWLIAQALAHGGAVVTLESKAGKGDPRVKIPNVCEALSVECISVYDMLRREGVVFDWKPPRKPPR